MNFGSIFALICMVSFSACAAAGTSKEASAKKEHRIPASPKKLGIANCLRLGDTGDIFACFDATYAAEEDKLNASYGKLVSLLKEKEPSRYEVVREAERAWMRLRDADCKYEQSADEIGDAAGAANQMCRIKKTKDRRADLDFKLEELKQHLKEIGQ